MKSVWYAVMRTAVLPVMLMAALFMNPSEGFAAEGDPAAKAQLESACKAMEDVKSGALDMNFQADAVIMGFDGNVRMDFASDPAFGAHGTATLNAKGGKDPSVQKYEFYTKEEGKNYVTYYREGTDVWYKESYSKDGDSKSKDKKLEKDPAYQALLQEMKGCDEAVRFGNSTADVQEYIVSVDGNKFWTAVGNYAKAKTNLKDEQEKNLQAVIDALRNAGDLECEVTVDKGTNRIVSAKADLSNIASKFAMAMIGQTNMDDKQKMLFGMAASQVKLVFTMHGSEYNAAKDVTVPASVAKNAKVKKDKKDKKDSKK